MIFGHYLGVSRSVSDDVPRTVATTRRWDVAHLLHVLCPPDDLPAAPRRHGPGVRGRRSPTVAATRSRQRGHGAWSPPTAVQETRESVYCTQWSPVSIQTQRTQAPANRNGRSKQPIIEAANQTLALLTVFVRNAIDCVACVAFGWKPGLSLRHNFGKCWPVLKILSLLDSARNLQQKCCYISHPTLSVSLHTLRNTKDQK